MLILIKTLIVLVWMLMFLIVVNAPGNHIWDGQDILFDATACGTGIDVMVGRQISKLPAMTRLVIVDDEADPLRSRIIERLLLRNPGLILKIPG